MDEQRVIETDIENRGKSNEPVWVELGQVRVMKPLVREADGSQGDLFPSEARLRNLTYAAPMQLDMTLVHGDERQEPVVTTIGQLPIMIGSSACNLSGMSDAERIVHGEDPLDPGGYFIVNGTERVLMTLEDLASNKIMTEFTERYNERIYVAKVFSQYRGYRALVVVERNKKNLLEVSFPSVAGHLKFVDLMRALGLDSDHDDRRGGLDRRGHPDLHDAEPRGERVRLGRDAGSCTSARSSRRTRPGTTSASGPSSCSTTTSCRT